MAEAEFAPWGVAAAKAGRHHILGAKLLMQFRRSLLHTQKTWDAVKVAQLSDCAFLWSSDPVAVINAARHVHANLAATAEIETNGLPADADELARCQRPRRRRSGRDTVQKHFGPKHPNRQPDQSRQQQNTVQAAEARDEVGYEIDTHTSLGCTLTWSRQLL